MVEVYNESIYDLFVTPHDHVQEKLLIQMKGKEMHVPVRLTQTSTYSMSGVFQAEGVVFHRII